MVPPTGRPDPTHGIYDAECILIMPAARPRYNPQKPALGGSLQKKTGPTKVFPLRWLEMRIPKCSFRNLMGRSVCPRGLEFDCALLKPTEGVWFLFELLPASLPPGAILHDLFPFLFEKGHQVGVRIFKTPATGWTAGRSPLISQKLDP